MFYVKLNSPEEFQKVKDAGLLSDAPYQPEYLSYLDFQWRPAEVYEYPAYLQFEDSGKAVHWGFEGREYLLADVLALAGEAAND